MKKEFRPLHNELEPIEIGVSWFSDDLPSKLFFCGDRS